MWKGFSTGYLNFELNCKVVYSKLCSFINPLSPELNPICYLLALLGAHHFLHVSRIRVNSGWISMKLEIEYLGNPTTGDVFAVTNSARHSTLNG
jgi:transposase